MALDTTVGGANANSYATLAEATAYQATRTFSSTWEGLDTEVQEGALIEATRLLNAVFKWTGAPVDDIQALSWPRSGMFTRNGFPISVNVIPQELKDAESEYARLLADSDLTSSLQQDVEGLASVKAGPIEVKFRPSTVTSLAMLNAQLRLQTTEFAYLDKIMPSSVRLLLVPSWYCSPSVLRRTLLLTYP